MAAAAGRVRRKLGRPARFDRAADGGVALFVQLAHARVPVGARLGVVRKKRPCAARVAPCDVDILLERRVAELGEPEAMLLDQVDGEPVPAGRNRRAELDLLP